ncbi:hypothetical protein HYS84_01005 [Candidatus Saccharibacteria bacterium]|nr:hypothetical protein [Candidatus Saccharibacteria bacterium]
MEFRETGRSSHPYQLAFHGDEPEAVRAAYREYIYNLALKGNTGSISDFEAYIAGWEEDGEPHYVTPISYESVVEVLDEFAEHTDEVIQSIPEETGVPAFASDDIGERYRLGKKAVALAQQIREKAPKPKIQGIEDVEVEAVVTDEDISKLLSPDFKPPRDQ